MSQNKNRDSRRLYQSTTIKMTKWILLVVVPVALVLGLSLLFCTMCVMNTTIRTIHHDDSTNGNINNNNHINNQNTGNNYYHQRLHHVTTSIISSSSSSNNNHTIMQQSNSVNQVPTHHHLAAKSVGLIAATTTTPVMSSKPKLVGRRKLTSKRSSSGGSSSRNLLETCLEDVRTTCPTKNDDRMKDTTTVFPLVSVILQTLTNDSGTSTIVGGGGTAILSRKEKILRANTIKNQMITSLNTIVTNVASCNNTSNIKKQQQCEQHYLESFGMILKQMNVSVKVIQFVLDLMNRSSSSKTSKKSSIPPLNCEIDTTTKTTTTAKVTTATIIEMIRSLQTSTSTMMDSTIEMYNSTTLGSAITTIRDGDGDGSTTVRTILEDTMTIIELLFSLIIGIIDIVGFVLAIVFLPVFIILFLPEIVILLLWIILQRRAEADDDLYEKDDDCSNDDFLGGHDDTYPCADDFFDDEYQLDDINYNYHSLLGVNDGGSTRDELLEQLEQCHRIIGGQVATPPPPPPTRRNKNRRGRRDKLLMNNVWTNIVLKSDTIQTILRQLSSFQNTTSSELFLCQYKLLTCKNKMDF